MVTLGKLRIANSLVSMLLAGLLAVGIVASTQLLRPGVAHAAVPDAPVYSSPTNYSFNDTTQYFTVPAGVQTLSLSGWGGSGGAGGEATGGLGAKVSEQVSVTPGQILVITLGGEGGASVDGSGIGGAPGQSSGNPMNGAAGGAGPTTSYGAGGGGGGTEVDVDNGPTLLAAGGGGGGGGAGCNYGSFGGAGGNAGTVSDGSQGQGLEPGTGGPAAAEFEPAGGAGAAGDPAAGGGGGGGGGFQNPNSGDYGGGAGGTAGTDTSNDDGPSGGGGGGGGAGASYANPSATNVSLANAPAGNGGLTISWSKPTPQVSISINPDPAVSGQSVSVEVTFTSPGGFGGQLGPTGDAFVYDLAEGAGGGGPLLGTDPDTITVNVPVLFPGTHTIVAEYQGDSNFNPVTVTTALTVLSSTSVTLSASTTRSDVGHAVKLTAEVTNQTSTPATGTATVYDGSMTDPLGTVDLNAATPDLATLKTKKLAAGKHKLFAVYDGDSADAASTSSTLIVKVVQDR